MHIVDSRWYHHPRKLAPMHVPSRRGTKVLQRTKSGGEKCANSDWASNKTRNKTLPWALRSSTTRNPLLIHDLSSRPENNISYLALRFAIFALVAAPHARIALFLYTPAQPLAAILFLTLPTSRSFYNLSLGPAPWLSNRSSRYALGARPPVGLPPGTLRLTLLRFSLPWPYTGLRAWLLDAPTVTALLRLYMEIPSLEGGARG